MYLCFYVCICVQLACQWWELPTAKYELCCEVAGRFFQPPSSSFGYMLCAACQTKQTSFCRDKNLKLKARTRPTTTSLLGVRTWVRSLKTACTELCSNWSEIAVSRRFFCFPLMKIKHDGKKKTFSNCVCKWIYYIIFHMQLCDVSKHGRQILKIHLSLWQMGKY